MLQKHELTLACVLMKMASNEFSNHGCNDLDKPIQDLLTDEQWQEMDKEYHEMNGDPDEYDPAHPTLKNYDWICMAYLAKKFKKELESMPLNVG